MNRRRRLFALILTLALTVSALTTGALADGYGSISAAPASGELTELEVRSVINRYFAERAAFLQDASVDSISSAIADIVPDEVSHRTLLTNSGITFESSTITIAEVTNGYIAYATVNEKVGYIVQGALKTDTVVHKVMVIRDELGVVKIANDAYFEDYSDFRSCAYVSPGEAATVNAATGTGGSPCIIYVANQQVGYTPAIDNYTKYNEWYSTYTGINYNGSPWCAMFVSWCAEQANISKSIIPRTPVVSGFYNNMTYYARSSTTPRVGDLAIFAGKTHVGIVTAVNSSSGTYTVVEGNARESANSDYKVLRSTWNFTSTGMAGFCRPAYVTTNHSYTWKYTATQHWGVCDHCGHTTAKSAHSFSNSVCVTCGCKDEAVVVNSTHICDIH